MFSRPNWTLAASIAVFLFSFSAFTAETLNVLSFNIWGLYPVSGGKAAWRYNEIGTRLGPYDIVALQETWDTKTEDVVNAANFPYVARGKNVHKLLGGTGLITLSKHPIVETDHLRYKACVGPDCLADKGVLRTRVQLEDGSLLDVYNTHMNAWMDLGWDAGAYVRRKQIKQLAEWIKKSSVGVRYIVIGDFNSPDTGENYRDMQTHFSATDVYRAYTSDPGVTYARENPWAPKVPEYFLKSTRIDYIWVSGLDSGDIMDAGVVFTDAIVDDKPLSDHYGVEAQIRLEP